MANVLAYIATKKPTEVAAYKPGTYTSKYADQLGSALNTVTNWNYNPLQDASYQALAKVYGARGNIAAKNTLADAAALNGGYGTSYAVSAAQQARNQYNQELAALVPDLEANAYNKATTRLNALRDADNTDYGRFRDTEQDRQWAYTQNYQKYRDLMADYQWGQNYNLDIYGLRQAAASGGGGGGGRRRSGGGGYGGGGYGGGGGSSSLSTQYAVGAAQGAAKALTASLGSSLSGGNLVNAAKIGASQKKKTSTAASSYVGAGKVKAMTK